MAYPHVKLTSIQLNWTQLLLANTIIQVNKIYIRDPNCFQDLLAETINRAKNVTKPGQSATVLFCDSEKKVMRDYNLKYCCILSDKVKKFENEGERERIPECLEIYKMATELNLLFGPV